MWLAFVIICGVLAIIGFYFDNQQKSEVAKANQEYFEKCRREEIENKNKAAALDAKYGTCTKSIKWWFDESTNLIRVYEDSKIVVIKEDAYSFDDIIGVDYMDKLQNVRTSATIRTDNSSMIGRAAVGGLVAGGLGAAVGAATAKQHTSYDNPGVHDYVVLINTKKLSNPLIELKISNNISQVNEIIATINAVMAYNSSDY